MQGRASLLFRPEENARPARTSLDPSPDGLAAMLISVTLCLPDTIRLNTCQVRRFHREHDRVEIAALADCGDSLNGPLRRASAATLDARNIRLLHHLHFAPPLCLVYALAPLLSRGDIYPRASVAPVPAR